MRRRWHGLSIPIASIALSCVAQAADFNIPRGDLASALNAYSAQSGVHLMVSVDAIKGVKTDGVKGELQPDAALLRILSGTGFSSLPQSAGGVAIVRSASEHSENVRDRVDGIQLAAAQTAPASLETVTVTSSKIGGDIQNIPISITALSQEQLTATQTAGGPDLVKQVPNLTFSKTNFTGYNIQIRGIGTQAISVTTDPAVAVALNDIPFIRNHFFEQEFYDLGSAEVLRGPQGTLYGRNATAGVVNLVTARPTDQFEAMASAELGNYHQRRFEGMINLPIVDDRLDLRVAGEWTKRQGYSFNELNDQRVDGRDLWSGRVTLGFKPFENLQTTLVWEHFSEDDDRMRTAKQLCKTDPTPTEIGGVPVPSGEIVRVYTPGPYLSQGCLPSSLYSADAFEVPNGESLPYYEPLGDESAPVQSRFSNFNPYASTIQSQNLRVIETTLNPIYKAKNDTLELNADYNITPELTASSQTGYNHDFLWSTEDYNRVDTTEGAFFYATPQGNPGNGYDLNGLGLTTPDPNGLGHCRFSQPNDCENLPVGAQCRPLPGAYVNTESDPGSPYGAYGCLPDGVYCDPQLGCSDRLVAEDLSDEKAWQLSQEFRLASHFTGPFNFSFGGNYLHYETEENYYVFVNTLTMAAYSWLYSTTADRLQSLPWIPGVSDNSNCLVGGLANFDPNAPKNASIDSHSCKYIDPNTIQNLNNKGHNYFLSQNPYVLNSYAAFGEAYYNVLSDLKITTGLRWTEDQKHFTDIPSELVIAGYGYASTGVVNQQWDQFTGRFAANWTPKLDFTDQTLLYVSYAHGYKAGGANPPGAVLLVNGCTFSSQCDQTGNPVHPLTFKPEFIDAFELGSKNTLLDGTLTLNGDVFYYNYENYQISEIVDRTSINLNFDAHVKGAELESTWEPVPGLRFNFAGGWEDTALAKGDKAVDLMDRTAGNPGWMVVKPFVTQSSNCIVPVDTVTAALLHYVNNDDISELCGNAYSLHLDPATQQPYTAYPFGQADFGGLPAYKGFDPLTAPNNGEGFSKDLSGNKLPNAPPFTVSAGAQYTIPLSPDWAGTARVDYYWQDYSWARVFNDNPYDRLRGYTTVNLALILTNQDGWQVMGYVKNIFNVTDITGTFLNSDDSGLTTNVFLTDPRLFGVRITKNW